MKEIIVNLFFVQLVQVKVSLQLTVSNSTPEHNRVMGIRLHERPLHWRVATNDPISGEDEVFFGNYMLRGGAYDDDADCHNAKLFSVYSDASYDLTPIDNAMYKIISMVQKQRIVVNGFGNELKGI